MVTLMLNGIGRCCPICGKLNICATYYNTDWYRPLVVASGTFPFDARLLHAAVHAVLVNRIPQMRKF